MCTEVGVTVIMSTFNLVKDPRETKEEKEKDHAVSYHYYILIIINTVSLRTNMSEFSLPLTLYKDFIPFSVVKTKYIPVTQTDILLFRITQYTSDPIMFGYSPSLAQLPLNSNPGNSELATQHQNPNPQTQTLAPRKSNIKSNINPRAQSQAFKPSNSYLINQSQLLNPWGLKPRNSDCTYPRHSRDTNPGR